MVQLPQLASMEERPSMGRELDGGSRLMTVTQAQGFTPLSSMNHIAKYKTRVACVRLCLPTLTVFFLLSVQPLKPHWPRDLLESKMPRTNIVPFGIPMLPRACPTPSPLLKDDAGFVAR